jgi:hypothetical protein
MAMLLWLSFSLLQVYKHLTIVYYIQREQVKKIKGRKDLRDYSHEDKVPYELLKKRNLNLEMLENKSDPFFLWIERYMNESGF